MSPADPLSRRVDEGDASDLDEASALPRSGDEAIDGLTLAHDAAGLMELAKAYRAGTDSVGRDMTKCFAAYTAAAALGSAEGAYAVALFLLRGGVVLQDLAQGTARLREAADRGSIPARIHLGNLYELGIHYKADPAKADVWYRSAARAAGVDDEPDERLREQALAELGAGRYVDALLARGEVDDAERERLLARAKVHGYRSAATVGSPSSAEIDPPTTSPVAKEAPPPLEKSRAAQRKKHDDDRWGRGLSAFGFALLFVLAGAAAGYAASLGAAELIARGHALPVFGRDVRGVFPAVLGVLGVLPTALAYRFGAVLKALAIGAALSLVGFVTWGTGKLVVASARDVQGIAFGVAGFLAALLVLGLLGGTKRSSTRA